MSTPMSSNWPGLHVFCPIPHARQLRLEAGNDLLDIPKNAVFRFDLVTLVLKLMAGPSTQQIVVAYRTW